MKISFDSSGLEVTASALSFIATVHEVWSNSSCRRVGGEGV